MSKTKSMLAALAALAVLSASSAVWAGSISAAVVGVTGDVQISIGGGDWAAASDGDAVSGGDQIKTGPESQATLVWGENTMLVGALSKVEVESLKQYSNRDNSEFLLHEGRALAKAAKLSSQKSTFQVRTPTALAGVRGTGFEVKFEEGASTVSCIDGGVSLTVGDESVDIDAGFMAMVDADGVLGAVAAIPDDALEALKATSKQMGASVSAVASGGGGGQEAAQPLAVELPGEEVVDEVVTNSIEEFDVEEEAPSEFVEKGDVCPSGDCGAITGDVEY